VHCHCWQLAVIGSMKKEARACESNVRSSLFYLLASSMVRESLRISGALSMNGKRRQWTGGRIERQVCGDRGSGRGGGGGGASHEESLPCRRHRRPSAPAAESTKPRVRRYSINGLATKREDI
jgi:hypothetical protein